METIDASTANQLRSFIERLERLEEDKAIISQDIKEVFAEAKATGFDTKIIKTVLKIRKMDEQKRLEAEAILETYCHALGIDSVSDISKSLQKAA
jgi:uncharacterized protein (UPF0335 family)